MQRSKMKVIAEQEAEEGKAIYGKDLTKEMKCAEDKFIIEPSFVPIKDLILGRVSYGGMNPEVEKFMRASQPSDDRSKKPNMDADVDDVEMAEHFTGKLASTMAKKFGDGKINKRKMKKLQWKSTQYKQKKLKD